MSNVQLHRHLGRRCLSLISPVALPLLTRLQAWVSSGVDASSSAQVLRQVLSVQQAINAEQQAISARLGTVEQAVQRLKGKVDGLTPIVNGAAVAVEHTSKPGARGVPLADEGLAYSVNGECRAVSAIQSGKNVRTDPGLAHRTIDYSYLDDVEVKRGAITIPANSSLPDFPSFFLFAFYKSGSVLVNALVRDLLTECGVPLIDLPTHLFEHGIHTDTFQCDIAALFPLKGYCFVGFRDVPLWLAGSDVLRRARKVVIVRDPRDMLVSLYYSAKYSHPLPAVQTPQFKADVEMFDTELGLDEFCMAYAWLYNAIFWKLRVVLRDQDALVLRYEDFVYDKIGLAKDICRWCGVNVPEERIMECAAAYDAIPNGDEPHAHIRQVHPGDHKRKLRPDTIAVLNASLANFIDAFSYEDAAHALGRARHGATVHRP
jgi:hypothetical protein